MLLGFVGLGAVVETAYLPALHNLYGDSLHCLGFDVQPGRHPEGVTRCASLTELLSHPLDTLFITTASLQHLEVLEHAWRLLWCGSWLKNPSSPRSRSSKN